MPEHKDFFVCCDPEVYGSARWMATETGDDELVRYVSEYSSVEALSRADTLAESSTDPEQVVIVNMFRKYVRLARRQLASSD